MRINYVQTNSHLSDHHTLDVIVVNIFFGLILTHSNVHIFSHSEIAKAKSQTSPQHEWNPDY